MKIDTVVTYNDVKTPPEPRVVLLSKIKPNIISH